MESEGTNTHAVRAGSTVIVEDGATLPPRCIKCNGSAYGGTIGYTFVDSKVNGAPTGIISALIHFSSRRTGRVYLSLCRRHRQMRSLIRWGSPFVLMIGIALGVYANVAYPKPPEVLVWITTLLVISGLVPLGVYQQHYLKGRVANGRVWLSGAGLAFLDSLSAEQPIGNRFDTAKDCLFTVERIFTIKGRGLVLVGISADEYGSVKIGDALLIARPDGSVGHGVVRGVEYPPSIKWVERPAESPLYGILVDLDLDVPVGSVVKIDPAMTVPS
jgi:hypothetical protein